MPANYIPSNRWVQQAPVTLNQPAAVQNTWYPLLAATGKYTEIESIGFQITVANETLELELTVDGIVHDVAVVATVGSLYQLGLLQAPGNNVFEYVASTGWYGGLQVKGHNISIRMRKTTAAGAGTLFAKVMYATQG